MSTNAAPRTIERHCDVAVVGGSAAGLAAALQLSRQRRSVIVVDAGDPRNAPAAHMHGYLGHEAVPPADLMAIGRAEVRRHGGEVVDGRVVSVTRQDVDHLRLELAGGHAIEARRVLAATGLVDELPDIAGVAGQWGSGVVHCPFCHGYEVRDRRVVHLVSHAAGLHSAPLLRHLTERYTVVLHGWSGPEPDVVEELRSAGIEVIVGSASAVVSGDDGAVVGVDLVGGRRLPADAVVVTPTFRARTEAFASIGLEPAPHPSGVGDHLVVDAMGQTSVPGVSAAGNVADPSQQVLHAAADGSRVAAMIAFSLAAEDLSRGDRPSPAALDWDRRYGDAPIWSGSPNGTLVAELTDTPPGSALDVGAGEGADAVWLAERGWAVTAMDISRRALDRADGEARRRGLAVETLAVDANAADAFAGRPFDLVSAQYASIPRTPDDRAITNLLGAVSVGGTLLVVGHDLEPMRVPIDTTTRSRPFDPDAHVRIDDIVAVLEATPGWVIEIHEKRPRPAGAVSSHHVDDVVLRARRVA